MLGRAFLVWLLLLVAAVSVGVLRTSLLEPSLGDLRAHQLGSLLAIVVFVWVIKRTVTWMAPLASSAELFSVGLLWLCMTVAFEFLFGHYVAGHEWSALLADYRIWEGRLWPLVLLTILITPTLVGGPTGK